MGYEMNGRLTAQREAAGSNMWMRCALSAKFQWAARNRSDDNCTMLLRIANELDHQQLTQARSIRLACIIVSKQCGAAQACRPDTR